jgi:arsenate reductase
MNSVARAERPPRRLPRVAAPRSRSRDQRVLMLRVLFLCVHNSARSQIAEGLLRAMAGDRVDVYSAGSEPTRVHPFALRVLQDEGIDTSRQRSKSVDEFVDQRFDYVITLCAEEVCPIFPGTATRLHWELRDPAAADGSTDERLEAFQQTVSELKARLNHFIPEVLRNRDETVVS